MGNEANTDDLVVAHFTADPDYKKKLLHVERQKSTPEKCIADALKHASKRPARPGKLPGNGKPDVLVHLAAGAKNDGAPIIAVECKGETKLHKSADHRCPEKYAVDGALHYAGHLAKSFDVIAVAVSGQPTDELKVTAYRQRKGQPTAELLKDEHGVVDRLLSFAEYKRLLTFDPNERPRLVAEVLNYSRKLHNDMRDNAKLSESEKPLLVSAVLIALQENSFAPQKPDTDDEKEMSGFRTYKAPAQLAAKLLEAVKDATSDANIPPEKQGLMLASYEFIRLHPVLNAKPTPNSPSPLQKMVEEIYVNVHLSLKSLHDVDVLGQFYGEFLRYTGGDKRGLGIVLTPRHVCELFADLADVDPSDTVLDTCAGTGGFLIAAMAKMNREAGNDAAMRERIRSRGLVGVEQQPAMFSLGAANMMLRGDGKSNLYHGSCFDPDITEQLTKPAHERHERPNKGLINPPYSMKEATLSELSFVERMLDDLKQDGIGVAIVPMSCAIQCPPEKPSPGAKPSPAAVKEALLAKHTLLAVMSMPDELFYPVGTVTCIMVFKAKRPHRDDTETWFGYWKDDGFVKTRANGRMDLNGRWGAVRKEWLEAYRKRTVDAGKSVLQHVNAYMEWCAEAYMETDYSKLSVADFEDVMRRYTLYCLDTGVNPVPPAAIPSGSE